MAIYQNRTLHPMPEAEDIYRRWIKHLDEEFTRHTQPERRAELVRDELHQIYLGRPHGGRPSLALTSELASGVLFYSFEPENILLEAEYWGDVDAEKYAQRKPLLFLWKMFDRSPIGVNHWLGLSFRCMLARHIFAQVGKGVKIYPGVELTYGYNLSIGDNVTIRENARLDDRAGITLADNAYIGPYAQIYSYERSRDNFDDIELKPVTIGPRTRVNSYATIHGGTTLGESEII